MLAIIHMKINGFISNPWSKTEGEVGTQDRPGFSPSAASTLRWMASRLQRIRATERTKNHSGGRAPLKDVKNEGRSGDVYENKGQ